MYSCGEATNGRLGLGMSSGTVPIPRQITALSSYVVKKVAVHSGTSLALVFMCLMCLLLLQVIEALQELPEVSLCSFSSFS